MKELVRQHLGPCPFWHAGELCLEADSTLKTGSTSRAAIKQQDFCSSLFRSCFTIAVQLHVT